MQNDLCNTNDVLTSFTVFAVMISITNALVRLYRVITCSTVLARITAAW